MYTVYGTKKAKYTKYAVFTIGVLLGLIGGAMGNNGILYFLEKGWRAWGVALGSARRFKP